MAVDPLIGATTPPPVRWRQELALVALLWFGGALLFLLLTQLIVTPRRYHDEFFYWGIAKSLAAGQGISWRGAPVELRSFLYPLYIAPVFRLASSVSGQYTLVHAFNAIAATAVVLPTYLIARVFCAQRLALAAAAAALALPAMNFTGMIVTENLALPLCTAALAAILLACARPGLGSALLALAAIALAILVRTQFIVLPLVLVAGIGLTAVIQGRAAGEYLRAQRFLIGMIGVLVAAMVVTAMLLGDRAVGIYGAAVHDRPTDFAEFWFWLRSFAADSVLVTGIVPTILTWALLGSTQNRHDRRLAALVAVAISAAVLFVLQTAWFSAASPSNWRINHIFYERYIFYIAPIFFVGAVAAIGRVGRRAAVIAGMVATVVVAGFSREVVLSPYSPDAHTLAYLGYLADAHESWAPHITLGLVATTLLLTGVLALALDSRKDWRPAAYGRALAVLLPLFLLLLAQGKSWSYSEIFSRAALKLEPAPPTFAQSVGHGPIALLASTTNDPVSIFQAEFWNPRITRVYANPRAPINSPRVTLINGCRFTWRGDGRVLPGGCGEPPRNWYVVGTDLSLRFRDQEVVVRTRDTQRERLFVLAASPVLLGMASGVDRDDGRVLRREIAVWSFLRRSGELRLRLRPGAELTIDRPTDGPVLVAGRGGTITIPIAAGAETTRLRPLEGDELIVEAIELREGRGPWQALN